MPPTTLDVLHGTWAIDPAASAIAFSVKHLGVATVHGAFEDFDGALHLCDGSESATGGGHIRVASVRTGDGKRDAVLQSPDFFDAGRFPELTFTAVAFRALDGRRFAIEGDLTVRGRTERVTLDGRLGEVEAGDDDGARVGLQLRGALDRTRFGMPFADTAGSALVSDTVKLELDLVAVRAPGAAE